VSVFFYFLTLAQKYDFKVLILAVLIFLSIFFLPLFINFNFFSNIKFAESNILAQYKYIIGFCIVAVLFLFLLFSFLLIFFNTKTLKTKCIMLISVIFIFHSGLAIWQSIVGEHGDEWLYLLLAKSLRYDFDVYVENNFQKEFHRDDGNLLFRYSKDNKNDYKIIIRYLPIYSMFLAPGVLFGDFLEKLDTKKIYQKLAPPIINAYHSFSARLMNIFFSICFLIALLPILKKLFSENFAIIGFFLYSISMPFSLYLNQLYPETLSACLKILILYLMFFYENCGAKKNIVFILIAVYINFLLHNRNIVFFAIVICFLLISNRKNLNNIFLICSTLIILLGLYFLMNFMLYKSIFPYKTFTGYIPTNNIAIQQNTNIFNLADITKNFFGMLLDQKYGIIIFYPIFIFSGVGLYFLFKINKTFSWLLFFSFIFNLIFLSAQQLSSWTAGSAIPGRYLVFLTPELFIFSYTALFAFSKSKKIKKIFVLFIAYSLIIKFLLNLFHTLKFSSGHKTNQLFQHIANFLKFRFYEALPFCNPSQYNNLLIIYLFVILLVNIWLIKKLKNIN